MKAWIDRLFRRPAAPDPVTPQLDPEVAQRLARAGKDPDQVPMRPAEPVEIPPKPELPGFRGTVRFQMTLDEAGAVRAVEMDGMPYEHAAVLEAWAHAWRFEPARMDGKAHACRMVYEVAW